LKRRPAPRREQRRDRQIGVLTDFQDLTSPFMDLYRKGSKGFEGLSRRDHMRVAVWLEQVLRTSYDGFIADPKGRNPLTQLAVLTFATYWIEPTVEELQNGARS
jgi:hypothetical protein